MVFAHTIVEAPKKGAISRAAAISAPSVEDPTTNTSSSSGGRAGASGAAGTGGGAGSSAVATLRVWRGASDRGAGRRPRRARDPPVNGGRDGARASVGCASVDPE